MCLPFPLSCKKKIGISLIYFVSVSSLSYSIISLSLLPISLSLPNPNCSISVSSLLFFISLNYASSSCYQSLCPTSTLLYSLNYKCYFLSVSPLCLYLTGIFIYYLSNSISLYLSCSLYIPYCPSLSLSLSLSLYLSLLVHVSLCLSCRTIQIKVLYHV